MTVALLALSFVIALSCTGATEAQRGADNTVDGRRLQFRHEGGQFVDAETGSRWNILGQAVGGPLKGQQLRRLTHGDYFAFAWLAFRPQTEVFRD